MGSKLDGFKILSEDAPNLFNDYLKEALDERAAVLKKTEYEIHAETGRRPEKAKKPTKHKQKSLYADLEERVRGFYSEGIEDMGKYDVIGKGCPILLHRAPYSLLSKGDKASKTTVEKQER